jgi:hypothetical protein
VRGGRERRYRTRTAGRAEWEHEDPRVAVRAVSAEVARRAAASTSESWRLIGDAELWVDGAAWDDAVKRIADALEDLHTAARPPRTPETLHVSATAMLVALDADRTEKP